MRNVVEWSKYKGVSFDEPNGFWIARWGEKHLGYFCKELDAAQKVKKYVEEFLDS